MFQPTAGRDFQFWILDFDAAPFFARPGRIRETNPIPSFCHSERSEESTRLFASLAGVVIPAGVFASLGMTVL
jgi:hypothetical protein